MARVLGISCGYHDAAAALVVDGVIVSAIQEERLSGVKNDASIPVRAAEACLSIGKLKAADLDAIAYYENPYAKLERTLVSLFGAFPRSLPHVGHALRSQLGEKLWVLDRIASALGVPRKRVEPGDHHRSHAASAYFTSPHNDATVLTVDGVGEWTTTSIHHGQLDQLTCIRSLSFPHSIGLLYAAITAYLGFEVNEGEYKVMGLAAYGKPRYRTEFEKLIHLFPDGDFELSPHYFADFLDAHLSFAKPLEALLGPRRAFGRPWALQDERDQRYADIAATLQAITEEALLGLASHARRITSSSALCLAGGVALNAVANARLTKESGFEHVSVHPAAGDAGGALGAAILRAMELGDKRPSPMLHAALGVAITASDVERIAKPLGLRCTRMREPSREVAQRLASEDIIAFATGRNEWGPRALGQRSIVASARHEAMREKLNRVIKQREPFRPFAPVVREADLPLHFAHAPRALTRFMTTVTQVNTPTDWQAVTHIDGSARVQTVSSTDTLSDLLDAYAEETGSSVLVNTSMNGAGDPIATTAASVLSFFLRHRVDALAVDDLLVERPKREAP